MPQPKRSAAPVEPAAWRQPPSFRVLAAGITIDPAGATYGPRKRRHFELLWIMEGEAKAQFDGQVLQAPEGSLLLRLPEVRDYYEWSSERRTVHAFIHFDLDPARRKALTKQPLPSLLLPPLNDILRPLFSYLLQLADEPEAERSRLMLPALELLLKAWGGPHTLKPAPAEPLHEPVKKAAELLRSRLGKDPAAELSLDELADAVNSSTVNLCRLFKRDLDLGPLEYARLLRLDNAATRLHRSSQSLKEIAEATGFYDGNHFTKQFKAVYGLSPKEFRASELSEWLTQRNPIVRMLYRISDKALAS
jgi:AraC-like DNA-binding protein